MKRIICALLALCLLCAGAYAECALNEVAKVTNTDFVSDSVLLRVSTGEGYRVMTIDGEAVTPDAYGSVQFEYGYVVAAKADGGLNAYGAFDAEGNVVLPYQYGDIEFLSADWALGYVLGEATADQYDYTSWSSSNTYYIIDTVDVYSLAAGKCVATLPRANFMDAYVAGSRINIEDRSDGVVTTYDAEWNALGTVRSVYSDDYADSALTKFRENGQYGLMDADGQVVMAPSFYTIYDFTGNYAEVSTGEREGVIDAQGQVVVPAEYESVKRSYSLSYDAGRDSTSGYNAAGYFGVVLDGKLGFVREGGEVTCEPRLSEKLLDFNGASATYTDMEGAMHILAADGVDTVIEGYQRVYCADYSAGRLYRVTDEDYNYGVIDWHGNVVLPCAYKGVSFSGDGRYILADVTYDESVIYEIVYEEPAAGAAAQADASLLSSTLNRLLENAASGEQSDAQEEPAADTAAAVSALIDSALAVLDGDAQTAATLLTSAAVLAGDSDAAALLTSAVTLIQADAAANAASVRTILETAKAML